MKRGDLEHELRKAKTAADLDKIFRRLHDEEWEGGKRDPVTISTKIIKRFRKALKGASARTINRYVDWEEEKLALNERIRASAKRKPASRF